MKTTASPSISILANTTKTGKLAFSAYLRFLLKQLPASAAQRAASFVSSSLLLALLLACSASQAGMPGLPAPNNPLNTQAGLPSSALQSNLNARRARLSQQEAIVIAEDEYEGRALGVKRVPGSGGTAYRVRILKANGKVKNVLIQGSLQQ